MTASKSEKKLNDFQIIYRKRLESILCRMNYIQPLCNTATAVKLCENYIIDGAHCVDVISACRNITFEKDNKSLVDDYKDFYDHNMNSPNADYYEWRDWYRDQLGADKNDRNTFQFWTLFLICALAR